MVNDNDGGTGAERLPSLSSLARSFRAALAHADAGWQRFLTASTLEPNAATRTTPGMAGELRAAIRAFRGALVGVGIATGLINVLSLAGPLFMLQVYDRVLPSRSVPTLVGLALLVLVLFAFQGLLDMLRGRILLRIGRGLDEKLSPRAFEIVMRSPLQARPAGEGLQSIRDLDSVRSFVSSVGLTAFFDLPWMPLYVAVCFLFHPLMGFAVLFGALGICSLTLLTEALTRGPSLVSVALATSRRKLAEAARRNAALLQALGMRARMTEQWMKANDAYLQSQQTANDMVAGLGSLSRVLRIIMQSAVLGVGAYLVINQEATAGVMLAATILSARALAPVELAIANWKAFVTARQSWRRLSEALIAVPKEQEWIALPPPARNLRVTADHGGAAGNGRSRPARRELHARRRQCAGRDRSERIRQDLAGAGAGRASGSRCAAPSGSTAPRLINGARTRSAGSSATCRRRSSCSRARSRRTSRASNRTPSRAS